MIPSCEVCRVPCALWEDGRALCSRCMLREHTVEPPLTKAQRRARIISLAKAGRSDLAIAREVGADLRSVVGILDERRRRR